MSGGSSGKGSRGMSGLNKLRKLFTPTETEREKGHYYSKDWKNGVVSFDNSKESYNNLTAFEASIAGALGHALGHGYTGDILFGDYGSEMPHIKGAFIIENKTSFASPHHGVVVEGYFMKSARSKDFIPFKLSYTFHNSAVEGRTGSEYFRFEDGRYKTNEQFSKQATEKYIKAKEAEEKYRKKRGK